MGSKGSIYLIESKKSVSLSFAKRAKEALRIFASKLIPNCLVSS